MRRTQFGTLGLCVGVYRSTWVAATTEGLLVYSLDEETMFDPTDLGEDVTPAAAATALQQASVSNHAFRSRSFPPPFSQLRSGRSSVELPWNENMGSEKLRN